MKKLIAILLLTFGLMGCRGDVNTINGEAPDILKQVGFVIESPLYYDKASPIPAVVYKIRKIDDGCKTYVAILVSEFRYKTYIQSVKCIDGERPVSAGGAILKDGEPVTLGDKSVSTGGVTAVHSIKYHTMHW